MKQLFDGIPAALGTVIAVPEVQAVLHVAWVCLVILWVAATVWAYRDAQHRVGGWLAPAVVAVLVVAATPLAFPLGLVVYYLVRPQETLEDATERRMSIEALEAAIDLDRCQVCDGRIDAAWVRCPTCRATLRVPCPECASLVEPAWSICPWCVAELPAALGARPIVWPIQTPEANRPAIRRVLGAVPGAAASSAPPPVAARRPAGERVRRTGGLPDAHRAAGQRVAGQPAHG